MNSPAIFGDIHTMSEPSKLALRDELVRLKKRVAQLEGVLTPNTVANIESPERLIPERLLVVDDHAINREMICSRLRIAGFDMVETGHAQAALEYIKEQSFDLILLDIMMSGMSGLEVLSVIRKEYSMGELPVMIVTARDQSQDMVARP
jgi:CheY-like chemotaxis protein